MKQDRPKLITFGISPYCEKARWALDWHGIDYQEIGWPVGLHEILARRSGAKTTTVPILVNGDELVQGSGAIIDWADEQGQTHGRQLTLPDSRKVEQRADDIIGVHMRRLYFAEVLPRFPHLAKTGLFYNTVRSHRFIGNMMWPVTWRVIMRKYDIVPEAAADSRSKLEAELDWLDDKLADGRAYLVGDRFSRADLTVASLLAPMACSEEIPAFRRGAFPNALIAGAERWAGRPIMRWVKEQYEAHRAPMRLAA